MARDPKHDVLFDSITIGPKRTRNRFWQTSHCAGPGAERPGAQAHFRGMKAEGGWGVVFTEFCSIHPESDEYPYTSARIWDQGDVVNLGYMCEIAHRHGSLAGIQLWYSGGNAPALESREVGRSPSQWLSPLFATRSVYGCEMDDLDIRSVINMYVEAGKRAEAAGFDLLEVSAGDDTLPIQFLEPRFNRRTDHYGGSFANRSRFYIELLHALKRELGDRCGITTRFEMDTLHGPEGVEAHEDGVRLLELFRREGVVDLVALKIGDYAEWGEDAGASRFRKSGWMTPFIKQGKGILGPNIPVVGNGRLTSPDDMVALIRGGVLDIIGAARPSIADPFLPTKISEGRLEDIRECIGCNICVSKFQQGGQIMCTQNVTVGEEYRRGWHPEKFTQTTQSLQRARRRRRPRGHGVRARPGRARLRRAPARSRDGARRALEGDRHAAAVERMEPRDHLPAGATEETQKEGRGAPRDRPNDRGRGAAIRCRPRGHRYRLPLVQRRAWRELWTDSGCRRLVADRADAHPSHARKTGSRPTRAGIGWGWSLHGDHPCRIDGESGQAGHLRVRRLGCGRVRRIHDGIGQ